MTAYEMRISDWSSDVCSSDLKAGLMAFALFVALLIGLPVLAGQAQGWALADSFFRAGSLVFGGGHVVLPLLQAETVTPGWVSDDAFLAGYGAAQAVPGPLFTFAAWLGAVMGDRKSTRLNSSH